MGCRRATWKGVKSAVWSLCPGTSGWCSWVTLLWALHGPVSATPLGAGVQWSLPARPVPLTPQGVDPAKSSAFSLTLFYNFNKKFIQEGESQMSLFKIKAFSMHSAF